MNAVEATSPKIRLQARTEKIGSSVIGQAPSITAPAISAIGRLRFKPLSIAASRAHDLAGNQVWIVQQATSAHDISSSAVADGIGGVIVC
ncbi:MAG: hypothetical protein ABI054_12680 [Planctomycetota bacterium]